MPTRAPTTAPAATVHNTVASRTGAWSRSSVREVPITDLQRKFGWTEDSWQAELLKTADAATTSTASRRGNGSVSASELQKYLAKPADARFLTSTAMQEQRDALEQKLAANGSRSVSVNAFKSSWQDSVARKADFITGDADGRLSRAELEVYLQRTREGRLEDSLWLPDQQVASYESRIAEAAGEVDPLRPAGDTPGLSLIKEYMRLSMDQAENVPTFVSYLLSAADVKETPANVTRLSSAFLRDPELRTGVTDGDYVRTGFDRGHMKPAEDSPTQEAMDESHLMSNIAPQHGRHNQQTWRTLEQAVNELVTATGGKAHIITGNLFLDAEGKPLPPEKVQRTGSQSRSIAVPTHNFKTVLLELPNKSLTAFAYIVPNIAESPIRKEEVIPFLAQSRVPVDRVEALLGQDLYAQLPKQVQAKLEKDTSARVAFHNASQYHSATLLWPQ